LVVTILRVIKAPYEGVTNVPFVGGSMNGLDVGSVAPKAIRRPSVLMIPRIGEGKVFHIIVEVVTSVKLTVCESSAKK